MPELVVITGSFFGPHRLRNKQHHRDRWTICVRRCEELMFWPGLTLIIEDRQPTELKTDHSIDQNPISYGHVTKSSFFARLSKICSR